MLAVPDDDGLRYVGRVGTGCREHDLDSLLARLRARSTGPLTDVPAADPRDANCVTPALIGEVEFSEWTPTGKLRHPSWRWLRPDKSPEEVRIEGEEPTAQTAHTDAPFSAHTLVEPSRRSYTGSMNPKLLLLLGLGVGYVLGARAGREPYEKLAAKADEIWTSPRVAKARREVEAYARQQAPIIRERAEAAAKAAPGFVADTAKDVATKVTDVAGDIKDQVGKTAGDIKDQVGKTAGSLRERGEEVVERAAVAAGRTRDSALEDDSDDEVGATR